MNRLTDILINLPKLQGSGELKNPLFELFSELSNFSTIGGDGIQTNLEGNLLPKR